MMKALIALLLILVVNGTIALGIAFTLNELGWPKPLIGRLVSTCVHLYIAAVLLGANLVILVGYMQ